MSESTCAAAGRALTVTMPAQDVVRNIPPALPDTASTSAGREKERSQFYTRSDLAKRYYRRFRWFFNPARFQIVEPGAGTGAFLVLLPLDSFGCDIEPKRAGIYEGDFLTLHIDSNRPIACIGNPPFGKNAKLAISFFNHAASFAEVIAFIVPRTFRKTGTINSLDDRFHLLYEEDVPDNAFLFQGKPRSVPTVFQIWVRREDRRAPLPAIKEHRDFEFLPEAEAEDADFALQRIGKNAGTVHHGLKRSHNAHYFIKGDVEAVMKELKSAFAEAAANTAGKPSLAKSEVVSIYSARVASDRDTKG